MRFAFYTLDDNFIITPSLVVSLGRCESCPKVHAVRLLLSWLIFEVGIEFDL